MDPQINNIDKELESVDITTADDQTFVWLADLNNDEEVKRIFAIHALSENKQYLIKDEIKAVAIGRISISEFISRVYRLISELSEIEVNETIQDLSIYVVNHLSDEILGLP